ncbi:hypothetical protein FWF48_02850 [Candidatus Saccharibacteria bacterium]|nr:hypothetical protein [Candidatus Saccharibacteria bacterium]
MKLKKPTKVVILVDHDVDVRSRFNGLNNLSAMAEQIADGLFAKSCKFQLDTLLADFDGYSKESWAKLIFKYVATGLLCDIDAGEYAQTIIDLALLSPNCPKEFIEMSSRDARLFALGQYIEQHDKITGPTMLINRDAVEGI